MGIVFAVLALVCWGVGDFLIQRSVRSFGDWMMIFYIDLVGVIMFTPFVINSLPAVFANPTDLIILLVAGISMISTKSWSHFKVKIEKGVFLAVLHI